MDLAAVAEHLRALEIDVLDADLEPYGRDETMNLALAREAAEAIPVLVELDDVEVERNLELAVRARGREDPAQHLGLVDLETVGQGQRLALRARDLAAASLDAHEVVGHVLRRLAAVPSSCVLPHF